MTVTRANVEATKAFIRARLGNPYVYGGALSPTNLRQGTDCSEAVQTVCELALGRYQPGRQAEGATTESYRNIPVGGVGPFGTICVARPADIPADAAVKIALHHGPGGGANSHMWCEIDGMRVESGGSKGLVTQPSALAITDPYATAWCYLPGPIAEDGTAPTVAEPQDTLYADVSEWQTPVTDAYPHRVLCIRSNDGTYRDKNFATNYAWMRRALDDGRLAAGIVYFVWRPNWRDAIATLTSQINTNGGMHPKVAVMLDVESWGGQIRGDQSAGINAAFDVIADWIGDRRRVIGYGNTGDLNALWPTKPAGVRLVVASYGRLPVYGGMIAHQYTDGSGFGGGLPEGAPPWATCDMNAANGYTPTAFAAALGITSAPPTPVPADPIEELLMSETRLESLSLYATPGEGAIYTPAQLLQSIDGMAHRELVERDARLGDPDAIKRIATVAAGAGKYRDPTAIAHATAVLADIGATHPEYLRNIIEKG